MESGLTVILHEDHGLPSVAVNVWYHVGSKDEVRGKTGFAHLFEHMMFQGSEHSPGDFFTSLEEIGGRLNGSTSEDRTNYWEVVPSEYLERALFLESDRMGFLLPAIDQRKLDTQREVVKNERRQSYENQPYGMAEEHLLAALYPDGHPYHHTVIGSMEDLDRASLDDIGAFFRKFYTPANASLCIAGDIEPVAALRLAEKYFAEIPGGTPVGPPPRFGPGPQKAAAVLIRDRVQLQRVYLTWSSAPHFSREDAAFAILGNILQSGRDSRLQRRLMVESQMAQSVYAYQHGQEIAGRFTAVLTAQPGYTARELEDAALGEISRLASEGPSGREIADARAAIKARTLQRMQSLGGFGGVADTLNRYQTMLGAPGYLKDDMARYERLTVEDIREAASRLGAANCLSLTVVPDRGEPAKAARSALPGPSKEGRFAFPEIQKTRLENGVEVWSVPRRRLPLVAVVAVLKSGASADPAGLPGLADFTAGMLEEGAAGQDSVSIALRQKAVASSIYTEVDYDCEAFSMTLLKEHLKEGVRLLGDIIMRPDFEPTGIERLRREKLADLARLADSPEEVGDRLLRATLYGRESPYGHPSDGTPAGVSAVSREDIARHFSERFRPDNLAVMVSGMAEPEEAFEAVLEVFGPWARPAGPGPEEIPAPPPTPRPGLFLLDRPKSHQSYIAAALPCLNRTDARFPAMVVLNAAMGGLFTSRLNLNLREAKGYTYGLRSNLRSQRGVMPWVLSTSVQTDKTPESLEELRRELDELKGAREITPAEFASARDGVVNRYPAGFETVSQLAFQAAFLWVHGLPCDYHESLLSSLRGLSLEKVREAAEILGRPGEMTWVVVGDGEKFKSRLGREPEALGAGWLRRED